MKKILKRITAAFLAVGLLCCLCSCGTVDELRENQIFWDESHTSVSYNGENYYPVVIESGKTPFFDSVTTMHLTDNDVPVLLSGIICQYANVAKVADTTVIYDIEDYNYHDVSLNGNVIYCKKEDAQKIQEDSRNECDNLAFLLYEDNEDTGEWKTVRYRLSDAEAETLMSAEPVSVDDDVTLIDMVGSIYVCSDGGYFGEELPAYIVVNTINGKFYICNSGTEKFVPVPEDIAKKYFGEYKVSIETVPESID